jgi:hypothetical protein
MKSAPPPRQSRGGDGADEKQAVAKLILVVCFLFTISALKIISYLAPSVD